MKKSAAVHSAPPAAPKPPCADSACQLQPRCEGCDVQQLDQCYDVRLCTNTVWEAAGGRLIF